jgi:hypothetical protein
MHASSHAPLKPTQRDTKAGAGIKGAAHLHIHLQERRIESQASIAFVVLALHPEEGKHKHVRACRLVDAPEIRSIAQKGFDHWCDRDAVLPLPRALPRGWGQVFPLDTRQQVSYLCTMCRRNADVMSFRGDGSRQAHRLGYTNLMLGESTRACELRVGGCQEFEVGRLLAHRWTRTPLLNWTMWEQPPPTRYL